MSITRRQFLGSSAAAVLVAGTMTRGKVFGANEKVRMAVIGFHGRGKEHMDEWTSHPDSEIVALCDVDASVMAKGVAFVKGKSGKEPKTYTDMRKLFESKDIDAVSIATPNHWHSLAAIWAMEAGKDVYVEKPCSHNVWEGRQLVNAARKYNRICQHGTQIRSSAAIIEAMQKLREGVIGEVYMARGLCYKTRDTIGHKEDCPVPEGVDYDTWLGPAPARPFNPNRFHYNWHYHWDYGNGDLGNQGVHQMDVARWGLDVGLPTEVSAMGGMYLFDDDKQVPNVVTTAFHYPDAGKKGRMLVFEVRPWRTNDEGGVKIGDLFYGSEGYMAIDSYEHYQTFLGPKGERGPGREEGGDHFGNFLTAVKARDPKILKAEVEEGHLSSSLCHMGLISAKLGRSFKFDPKTEQVVGDDEANKLLKGPYEFRAPFTVPEVKI
jgi:predicted dehydrogenase